LPQPPSPSKGMGVEYVSRFCFGLDLEGENMVWMGVRIWVVRAERKDGFSSEVVVESPPLLLSQYLDIIFGSNVIPAANRNATRAVLQTSDSNTARKEDHTPLVDGAARCANSTGERRGRSRDTARLEGENMGLTVLIAVVDAAAADAADSAKLETLAVRRVSVRSDLFLTDLLWLLPPPFQEFVA